MKFEHFYSYFHAIKSIKKLDSKLEKDGWVVKNDLDLSHFGLYFLPIIKKINGSFDCIHNQLTSLQGAPQEVGGYFDCSDNKLTTLQGAPQDVGCSFYCHDNQLTTLQGVPQKINGDFICNNNQIKDCSGQYKIKVDGNIYK